MSSVEEKIKNIMQNNTPAVPNKSKEEILIDKLVDPENAVNLKLSERIGKDLDSVSGSERLKKTSQTIIDTTLKTEETKADVKKSRVEKSASQVYFDTHSAELKTGGILEDTYIGRMEKVVKTNDIWFNVIYYMFLWWVIGINTLSSGTRELNKFFKTVIWFFTGLICVPFIPTAICLGIVRAVIFLILLPIKSIVLFIYEKIARRRTIFKEKEEPTKTVKENLNNIVVVENEEVKTETEDETEAIFI